MDELVGFIADNSQTLPLILAGVVVGYVISRYRRKN